MADIFVSYTSSDQAWAFWIGQELVKLGHKPHIHEWEISAGGDIVKWMDERLKKADSVLCVVSAVYLTKDFSGWELRSAQWAAQNKRLNFMLPVFIEACEPPPLLAPVKRCDLYGISEQDARARLAAYLAPAARPPGEAPFPGRVEAAGPASFSESKPTGSPPAPRPPVSFPGFARQPRNLPFASLGDLFKGRDKALDDLRVALLADKNAPVVGRALHGLGGVGKTRLAIEYAWRREADYSALLFVRADNPATLNANLATLAGAEVLNLPEKEAREDAARIEAALGWLEAHPTWLMILDNVDDREAVAAVSKLMARLKGGHLIVTARAANFPASLRRLPLDVLDEDAATAFLMERTRDGRAPTGDDEAQARALAEELGGLALGLEQAAAYIARQGIGFKRYLALWREKRASVLEWFDRTETSYDHDVGLAMTWATSVEKLTPESRRLLDRLAFLATDPIPDSLLDVAVPGEAADYDAHEARAGLYAYSLITRASGEHGAAKGFVIHRLVQDFARRAMTKARGGAALRGALRWVNAAFVGGSTDVRNWPVLEPLAPHALAVARRADDAAIAEPTGRLFNQLAILSYAKARYAEAERLYRRALAIGEASLGPDHPDVATYLNNLANLLRETNRPGEAEPLYRRALAIDESHYGPDHPDVAVDVNNLAGLLQDTNRLDEAEPLFRRALAIGEASFGPDHPTVAIRLNNLAMLLGATNRRGEAEPLFRRALAIDEAHYGPDHPTVAIRLSNLVLLLQATNRLGEAEPLIRRALAIDEASYGPDHPNVAIDLWVLAALLRDTNRLTEAEPPLSPRAQDFRDEPRGGPPEHDRRARAPREARGRARRRRVSGGGVVIARSDAGDEGQRRQPWIAAPRSR